MKADAETEAALFEVLERFCMVCEKRDGRWFLVQVHGSSPPKCQRLPAYATLPAPGGKPILAGGGRPTALQLSAHP